MNARTLLGIWGGKDLKYLFSSTKEEREAQKLCQGVNPISDGYSGAYPNPLEVVFFKISNSITSIPNHMTAFLDSLERMQFDAVAARRPEIIQWRHAQQQLQQRLQAPT